jgi:excisionase family DNA binding protein
MTIRHKGVGRLPEKYLTPADLAKLLGVPLPTIYDWRYKRIGPPGFRVGRHLRYDPKAVREWIEGLTEGVA